MPKRQQGLDCAYSRVRARIDNSIQTILQTHNPKLHFSICFTPYDLEMIIGNGKYSCLEVLGTVHSIGEESLSHAYCNEHGKTTEIKDFRCWFCDKCDSGESDLDTDKAFRTVIRNVISELPNLRALREVAEALGMKQSQVEQAYEDSFHQIRETTREVLHNWYNRVSRADGSHHELLHQLKDALEQANVLVKF